jgi:hypothetical protein
MKTTWKDIQPVPTSQEFLDIVLSRTQRRLPTQIRAGFQISRIRSMKNTYALKQFSLTIPRFLYSEGQIHPGDFYGKALVNIGRLSSTPGYSSFSQRPSEYPLRCRPFSYSSWTTIHRKTSHRDSVSRLCSTPEICPITLPMQATQARRSRPYGHHLPKA